MQALSMPRAFSPALHIVLKKLSLLCVLAGAASAVITITATRLVGETHLVAMTNVLLTVAQLGFYGTIVFAVLSVSTTRDDSHPAHRPAHLAHPAHLARPAHLAHPAHPAHLAQSVRAARPDRSYACVDIPPPRRSQRVATQTNPTDFQW